MLASLWKTRRKELPGGARSVGARFIGRLSLKKSPDESGSYGVVLGRSAIYCAMIFYERISPWTTPKNNHTEKISAKAAFPCPTMPIW